MKKYMMSVMKSLVMAGYESNSEKALRSNSYAVMNVSPRFF